MAQWYERLISFNQVEMNAGIAETLNLDEKQKNEQSVFVKIFKMLLSISIFFAAINYIVFGPEGFKLPKY